MLYVLIAVNVLRIAGLTTNIAPTDIQRARLLFSAAQAILNDCNQKMKRPHRCSPLYRSIAIRQEEIGCKIWTFLHLYRLILIFRIFLHIYAKYDEHPLIPPGISGGVKYATFCIYSIFSILNLKYDIIAYWVHIFEYILHIYCIFQHMLHINIAYFGSSQCIGTNCIFLHIYSYNCI